MPAGAILLILLGAFLITRTVVHDTQGNTLINKLLNTDKKRVADQGAGAAAQAAPDQGAAPATSPARPPKHRGRTPLATLTPKAAAAAVGGTL